MRKLWTRGLAVALLLSWAVGSGGQEAGDAKVLIDKGIVAQGGARNLAKILTSRAQGKGRVFIGGQEIGFTIDLYQQLPGKSRTVLKLDVQGTEVNIVQIVNGDQAWNQVKGTTTEADADSLAHAKFSLYASRVSALLPLLTEPGFTLTSAGAANLDGISALGVLVASTGQKNIYLYFDKDSGLLVKLTRPGVDPANNKTVTQDEFYSDYKEFDGVKQPTKLLTLQDGKKFMEANITEYSYPQTFDEKMFTKPE